jgi:hypothetical protein
MPASLSHPHGALRRKDREITDRHEIDGILRSAQVMHLALADGNVPFVVPVFYTYDGTALYFHSAQAGTKVEILKRNPVACFEVSLDHGVIEDEKPCDFEAKHRTVIGLAKAVFVTDETEKVAALHRIVGLFTEKKFEFPPENLARTLVVRLDIESIKGKKHGY